MVLISIGLSFCLFLLIYPYLIYPILLRLLPKKATCVKNVDPQQQFSLLFCARNEASALPETLTRLRLVKSRWPELQILAFNDASDDETGALLDQARDILTVTHGLSQVGKATGINRLLQQGKSDIVLFMDANVIVVPTEMISFRNYFANPDVGAVGAHLLYVDAGDPSAQTGSAYWRLEEQIKALETGSGSTMGCDGALWGIRRSLYPVFDTAQCDDFRPSMQPIFEGMRVVSAPDIRAIERIETDGATEFIRKIRVACGAWHAHRAMRHDLARMHLIDRFKYNSHKVLRWFSGLWLILAVTLAGMIASALGMLMLYLGILLISLGLAGLGLRPFSVVLQIALAMLATLIGILWASLGRSQEQWTPVRA